MTAETSNARGEVVAERQAWYEQQIALAEGQWAAAFLDRWECGDDVPSKEHYVALWLAERAAPPPAAARGDVPYDRELIAQMLDAAEAPAFTMEEMDTQARLLREAAQAKPEAQGDGELNISMLVRDGTWVGTYAEWCRRKQIPPPSAPVGAAEDMVLDAIERRESSAPVGVDATGSRAWMAEVCRAAALSLAAHGVRNDQLSKVADWIDQQPADVVVDDTRGRAK